MEYLTLGKIVKTVGLKGELKVYSSTDFGAKRYVKGKKVFLFNEQTKMIVEEEILKYRRDGQFDIITLSNKQDINLVEKYVGWLVQVEKNLQDLDKGFYYFSDLESCNVYDQYNNLIGKVKKVESYASYNTLRITRENDKDVLVPFVKAFIKNVNIEERKITINVIDGLL
ncbi:MAG: ribosome maturation factor RimM [Bacilli bacterium]